jgi:uncharacterized protein (TIGR03067 family)
MHRIAQSLCAMAMTMAAATASAQFANEAVGQMQGTWTAAKAERDGKAAPDVVGNRLSVTGSRFDIRSKGGKLLYSGTYRLDATKKPATIDFAHNHGKLKGKDWKGIYALEGGTLTICDNAVDPGKERPKAFQTKAKSGIVCIDFRRARS